MTESLTATVLRETEESNILLSTFEDVFFMLMVAAKRNTLGMKRLRTIDDFFIDNLMDNLNYYLEKYGDTTCLIENLRKKTERELEEGSYLSSFNYRESFFDMLNLKEDIYPCALKFFDQIFNRVEILLLME